MPNIRQTLLIAATPEHIYDALTTSGGLSAWWTPNVQAIPEPGTIASFPFANGYVKRMQIENLTPAQTVQWKCIEGDHEWIGTTILFTLVQNDNAALLETNPEIRGQIEQNPAPAATMLHFHQDDWGDYTATFAECSYTWGQFLRSLKLYCETGKGKPWPGQHSI
ncbi:Activator of Hsp90 ATPase homolog 1-like protein [Dyadobacter soli]|uniref:Activator of Hsp90 ATPase homolog 1-like protein n=1 Tax=Dyadobacter soli TaxID=659014 RepID=A0A1G7MD26_9BACT|nr:SRPBCC domain-containing protein [Dyadobacter soli]SDF59663.1 Activator of Hsp90 ATPase homolog 1-like protein [Dyadobacter soli]